MEETLPKWIGEDQMRKYESEPWIEQNLGTRAKRRREHLMGAVRAMKTLKKYHQWWKEREASLKVW
jgi:hypothetical protein